MRTSVRHCQDAAVKKISVFIKQQSKEIIHHSDLGPVGHQRRWQQQNKALYPHEEEFYCEVSDANSPKNLPEIQRLNSWPEENEAARRFIFIKWQAYMLLSMP